MENQFNILIIGKGSNISAMARILKQNTKVNKIFATCQNSNNNLYEPIDIREDNVEELLKFALNNDVNLSIAISKKAINSDIAGFFQTNGQNIFAPTKNACRIALDNIFCKKFLYRIHAQTSKFNVLEKAKTNYDLLHSFNFPVTIRNSTDSFICTTLKQARELISNLFNNTDEPNLLIEDFSGDKIFTMYFISDGYGILPISSVKNCFNHNFSQEIAALAPDSRISKTISDRISNIAKNIIEILVNKNMPYLGILGIECTLTSDQHFFVNRIKPFFSECDAPAIMNLMENDFLELINSCVNGFFSDEYEEIKTSNKVSASISLNTDKNFKQIEDENETVDLNYENNSIILTETATTEGFAKKKLIDTIKDYNLKIPESFS